MILSHLELRRAVEAKTIVFDPPLQEKQWGEASVDLRLGFSFTNLIRIPGMKISLAEGLPGLAHAGFWRTMELREEDELGKRESLSVLPGEFVLGFTHEKVTIPNDMIARVEGRSTYARVGLSMHQTAPWIQPGWTGNIVLEIMNNGPITVELTPLIDRPCQLTFFQLTSPLPADLAYGSRQTDIYKDQRHPLNP